jgi:hypothetical protein
MSIELVSNRVGETRVRVATSQCKAAAGSEVDDDDRASQAFLWSPLFIIAARE